MKHAFSHCEEFQKQISDKYVMLFLDYDGTLTPIVESPDRAILQEQIRIVLKRLSYHSRCKLSIISGRTLKDIKKRVDIRNIIYSGNHGLEIEGPNIKFKAPLSPHYRIIQRKIESELMERLSFIEGILLEDKGFSLSLHYQLVSKQHVPFVRDIYYRIIKPYKKLGEIKTVRGKKVLEIRPPVEWDKGKAVLWLIGKLKLQLGNRQILLIYIGDDVTDEDAFKILKNKGLTIFIGKLRKSHAKYYLKNTKEVFEFLKRLNSLLSVSPLSFAGGY